MRRIAVIAVVGLLLAACEKALPPVVIHAEDAIPDRLSEWGVVISNGDVLQLNNRIVPYGLNTPLFTDYALKTGAHIV